ncbi:MAG: DUF4350 domain-containing protein [Bacteroidia bacterium]
MRLILFSFLFSIHTALFAQQVADTLFKPIIGSVHYAAGTGPLVLIDGGHNNFHTSEGRFSPFRKLLEQDGYRVRGIESELINLTDSLKILVISNALNTDNIGNWTLPCNSAFSDAEIIAIEKWVKNGGRLLLIADHMPFAGAAMELAKAFGFDMLNGFAFKDEHTWPPTQFKKANDELGNHPVCINEKSGQSFDSICTFTGSAFKIPDKATGILKFQKGMYSMQPDTAWQFNEQTLRVDLEEYYQGAIMNYGTGKIALFGEAAMFSAQIAGRDQIRVGFNSEYAKNNVAFILNLIHWLDEP